MKNMNNPFTITFGIEPSIYLNRGNIENEIISTFLKEVPNNHTCMISGVRGSGKTVELTAICNYFKEKKDWIVLEVSPEKDIIHTIASKLSNRKELFQIFKDAKINLSIFGFGFELDNIPPITDETVALEEMLKKLNEKGKRILIAIDEVTNSRPVIEFISQYQIFLRQKLNIFLVMTGLYENINALQNHETLTFLYRSPRIELEPLNNRDMSNHYAEVFSLSEKESSEMAKLTKGYAYGFQILGYLCFKENKSYKDIIGDYDVVLEKYSYQKIWSELSKKDKEILISMSRLKSQKIEDIRNDCNMDSNKFTVYRKRLIDKGVAVSTDYGYLDFALPRFKEFILFNYV